MRLHNALGVFTSVYDDWSDFLVNPNYVRRGSEISWNKRRAWNLRYNLTGDDVALLSDEKQFSFQFIEDGSIFQLYYLYESDDLKTARLAYYNSGQSEDHSQSSFVSWVRVDFDPSAALGVSHASCHMHLSSFPASRLVVNNVPTPRQFIEFVISSFYPEIFAAKRLGVDGGYLDRTDIVRVNSNPFPYEDIQSCGVFTHLRFPAMINH